MSAHPRRGRPRAARAHPRRGDRALPPPVRARRDRLSRHEQGPLQRRPVGRRPGRRLHRRPVGPAAPELRRPRPLAHELRRARRRPARRRRRRPDAAAGSTSPAGCTSRSPTQLDGPDVDAVYEDIGELDAGSLAGLKALYSDARKRAGVAAGIGAYLYTALAAVVLPIGPGARQVQCIRRQGKSDLLLLSPATEAWLRDGYRTRMQHRDRAARPRPDPRPRRTRRRHRPGREHRRRRARRGPSRPPRPRPRRRRAAAPNGHAGNGSGELVTVDFGGLGPAAAARGMSPARARLAALAAAAGYGPDTLALIADAALPAHRPGERLDDAARRARRHRRRGARPVRLPAPTRSPDLVDSLPRPLRRAAAGASTSGAPAAHRRAALQPPALLRPLAVRGRPRAARRRHGRRRAARAPLARAA